MPGLNLSYRSEYYDILAQKPAFNLDMPIYLTAYKQMRLLRPLNESKAKDDNGYHVVDVGTGTGRVIRNLTDALIKDIDLSKLRFTGVDTASHVIDWARGTVANPQVGSVSYLVGSAVSLRELEAFSGPPAVDLLIFSAGGVSLLHEPTVAIEKFLGEVAGILRPGSGRAYIAVLKTFIGAEAREVVSKVSGLLDSCLAEVVPSAAYPGTIYRESKEGVRSDGNILMMDDCFEVVTKGSDGQDIVIGKDASTCKSRILKAGELLQLAAAVGLEFVQEEETCLETIFVFRVPLEMTKGSL
ncbi:hypothetical protein BDV12DRAFT_203067 [Aspergillus spectabilis]